VSSGILHLLEGGVRTDYAINSENSGNMVVNAFVGRSEGKIHVRAPGLHFHTKSIFPEFKERLTAFELMHLVQGALGPEMRAPTDTSWMSFEPHPELPEYPQYRMEVVEFHGIQHLVLELQIRTVPGMTDATIRTDLERLLDPIRTAHPYLAAEIEWPSRAASRPAVAFERDHPVAVRIAHWHEVVTGEPADVGALGRLGAAADASHVVAAGMDTILYGPGGGTTDREYRLAGLLRQGPPDERVCLSDVVVTAKVFALVAADLCG
jgi:acetylornithine deacetylase/succinyl-diaminopimelate desuccinylase-like protein